MGMPSHPAQPYQPRAQPRGRLRGCSPRTSRERHRQLSCGMLIPEEVMQWTFGRTLRSCPRPPEAIVLVCQRNCRPRAVANVADGHSGCCRSSALDWSGCNTSSLATILPSHGLSMVCGRRSHSDNVCLMNSQWDNLSPSERRTIMLAATASTIDQWLQAWDALLDNKVPETDPARILRDQLAAARRIASLILTSGGSPPGGR